MNDAEDELPEVLRTATFRRAAIYDAPEHYDVDYAGYRGEEAFYRLLLQEHRPPLLVELGAGTGRLTLAFAKAGQRVHAVEPAPAMRRRLLAKRSAAGLDDAIVTVEDATTATFVGPASGPEPALVIFPFNGVMHVETREDLAASFAHVRAFLGDHGRFALDTTGPYWEAMLQGEGAWGRVDERIHPTTGRRVFTCDRSRYDSATRRMRIDIRYVEEGADDGLEVILWQRMWTWQEVLAAMEEAGFTIEHLFGDVDLRPFDEGSARLLVSARPSPA